MKMTKILIAGVLALVATAANASTVFTPAFPDSPNFAFQPVADYELYMFDDADIGDLAGATNKLFIDVPEIVHFAASGGDFVATASSGSLTLSGSANFFIALYDTVGDTWIRDNNVVYFGADVYQVYFGSNNGIVADVREVPAVPVPAAAWLFGSGLIGLVGVARRRA